MQRITMLIVGIAVCLVGVPVLAQTDGAREVPARTLPVPTTVSPEIQQAIAAPIPDNWDSPPSTPEEWEAVSAALGESQRDPQPILDEFDLTSERLEVNGVTAYLVTPNDLPPENEDRLLMHIHGGCYVMGGGPGAMYEGALLAGYGRFRVLSVDYRRPPEFRFPAALDDTVAVWRGALEMADPQKMGIFGASAGGALTLSTTLRIKQEGLPMPAAIAPGTPMADLTRSGDTYYTNRVVDNVLIGTEGRCQAMGELYAGGHDLADPLLSPVNGDLSGFPPTILISGTRDLLLSDTVRVHRKLRRAGVEAELHVWEAQAHGHYIRESPERAEAFEEMAAFFDKHLAR